MFVCPLLARVPQRIHTAAKLPSGGDLPPRHVGLFRAEKARPRLAADGAGEAVVRAMAGLGILRTSALRLAALNRTFGKGATAHGLGSGQGSGELADARRNLGRGGSGHALSYGLFSRKTSQK